MEVAGGQGGKGTIEAMEDEIAFEGATVVTPANATLVRDLTLRVPCGTNLLVTGPNGSGKSSLFRVLGGLWPLTEGKMYKPGGQDLGDGLSHDIFYVPQRPYVTVGTLPDQLIYPLVQQGEQPKGMTAPASPRGAHALPRTPGKCCRGRPCTYKTALVLCVTFTLLS